MVNSLQSCRWYDPHPYLCFALKMFYIAPSALQRQTIDDLLRFLKAQLKTLDSQNPLERSRWSHLDAFRSGNRWYDNDGDVFFVVEVLRHFPSHLKQLSAKRILSSLVVS